VLQGFQADQGALRGVALMEAEDRLRYFPADALPAAPAARFAALFEARPRWAADDISPFLDGMQVGTRDSVTA
jgi:Sister chromatid cohesion protein Dcc1